MHRLSYIKISNFRACAEVDLPLEGFTPLVGQNNTGKSTILKAIEWLLKPSALNEKDFRVNDKPICIYGCIEGITADLLDKIPEKKHRTAIAPYCSDGKLWIKTSASGTSAKGITREIWNPENYPGEGVPEEWRPYPTGLPQAVSSLLPEPLVVDAMVDIQEDLGKAKSGTTIKGLLDEIMEPIIKAHDDLSNAMDTVRSILSVEGEKRSELLDSFDQEASKALDDFFPGLDISLDLQIVELKEFFKSGDLHVTDRITGDKRRFDQIGTGAQRSIQMSLILYLAETKSKNDKSPARRLLLIDEPELYLHPQGVKHLLNALTKLSKLGFQVIFATHSPLMLDRENAADTIIVGKTPNGEALTKKPLRIAVNDALEHAQSQARTIFELGNRSDIYFADRVVLCEGKTDKRLLPMVYKSIYGVSPELDRTAYISLGSCSDIPKAMPVLRAMQIQACAIADLDFAFVHACVGNEPLVTPDEIELEKVKLLLKELQGIHSFPLGNNGLPTRNKDGWSAADTWALFAAHEDGIPLAEAAHEKLKDKGIWIWSNGTIEDVLGITEKGEDAIIEQEERLNGIPGDEIDKDMPIFRQALDWVRSS